GGRDTCCWGWPRDGESHRDCPSAPNGVHGLWRYISCSGDRGSRVKQGGGWTSPCPIAASGRCDGVTCVDRDLVSGLECSSRYDRRAEWASGGQRHRDGNRRKSAPVP